MSINLNTKINKYPFKYMVWNIYGNSYLRKSSSSELFSILSNSHYQYKTSLITCNINNYMYKLSTYCNNKNFDENTNSNIIINNSCIFNISDIYDNNYFIKKISNGIYKPVNIFVYDHNDVINTNRNLENVMIMPINYTFCKDDNVMKKLHKIEKIISDSS